MSRRSTLRDFFAETRLKVRILAVGVTVAALVTMIWSSQSSSAATQGPVAAWSFDENTGSTVADLYGENEGTIEGAEWKKGVYGSALEFDGEESCVTVPNSATLQLGEEFTVEAWVRPDVAQEFAPIFFKEDAEANYGYALMARGGEAGQPSGYVNDGSYPVSEVDAGAELPLLTWSHLALTFDGAHIRLYVNGELVDSAASEDPVESHGALRIGCGDDNGLWHYFDGRIDEPRIYERALSATEIASDMDAPLQTLEAGPTAEWSFDANTGTVAEDLAGENDGTIEGATWNSNGKYGPALSFNGSSSCVKVPNSASLQLGEEFTLEAWVRPEGTLGEDPVFFKERGGEGLSFWKIPSYWMYVGFNQTGKLQGYNEEAMVTAPNAIQDNTWTHLAFTYDGHALHVYVNGELEASNPIRGLEMSSGGPLYIGCAPAYEEFFHGRIDEARIYERALSWGEVRASSEVPIETPKSGPVAAYGFDEGSGETAADVTGHGHTATLEGETKWAKGKFGDALSFLKEGDCASVADSPELRLSEEFTVEAWVRPDGGIYEDPVVVREASGKDVFGIGLGSREEGFAEAFIGEGKSSKAAVGGHEIREYEWVHIAATWDGTKIRLYVDGELAATKSTTTAPGTGAGDLLIGCDAPNGPFGGRIDEVRVYRRTLNEAEIDTDMVTPLQTPQEDPVAEYSFDEENEEAAVDMSGDGNTATVEGAKWTGHGRYGGAYEFDAAEEDVLKIPASEELDFDEEFTLEAWVRPSGADNHDAPLIDKQEGGGLGYSLYEGGSVSDRPYGAVEEGQEHVHADDPLPAHVWSHVALTFVGNRTYLYVDGEVVDNGAAEPVVTSTGELEIGGSTGTGEYFDGRIDEVRIYNRGLTGAEVAADMEVPIQTAKSGPLAAWSFDDDEGSTAEDVTGNEHEGTIEGAEWSNGKYGAALTFDGESDCVSVAASEEIDLGEEFTLEGWVKPEGAAQKDPLLFEESSGHVAWGLGIGLQHPAKPEGTIGTAGPGRVNLASGQAVEQNVWSYVAVTFDGASLRLYVDGVLVGSKSVTAPASNGTGTIEIGCDPLDGTHFKGRIDEVRVYDRALNGPEVAADEAATIWTTTDIGVGEDGTVSKAVAYVSYPEGHGSSEFPIPTIYVGVTSFGPIPEGENVLARAGRAPVEDRPYSFKYCTYFNHESSEGMGNPPQGGTKGLARKLAYLNGHNDKNGRFCEEDANDPNGGYVLDYSPEIYGTVSYVPGKKVMLEHVPKCVGNGNPTAEREEEELKKGEIKEVQNENFAPRVNDCFRTGTEGTKATNGLDVVGRFVWEPGSHLSGNWGHYPSNACGVLDGHFSVNLPPPSEIGWPITNQKEGFEHFSYFPSEREPEDKAGPCNWKHPSPPIHHSY